MMVPIPPLGDRMYYLPWACKVNNKAPTALRIKAHKSPTKRPQPKLKIRILVKGFDIPSEWAKYLCRPHRFLIYQENISLFDAPQIPLSIVGQSLICFNFSFFKIFQVFNSGKNFVVVKRTIEVVDRCRSSKPGGVIFFNIYV